MTYQRRGKSVSVVHWASFSLTAGLIMGFAPMDLKLREIIIFLGLLLYYLKVKTSVIILQEGLIRAKAVSSWAPAKFSLGGNNSNVENPNLWKSDIMVW